MRVASAESLPIPVSNSNCRISENGNLYREPDAKAKFLLCPPPTSEPCADVGEGRVGHTVASGRVRSINEHVVERLASSN